MMVLKAETNINIRFIPREPGIFTPSQVKVLADIMSQDGAASLRLVLDLPLSVSVIPELADSVREKLALAGFLLVPEGSCIKDVKICPHCDHGTGAYRTVGRMLNEELMGKETPAPVRVSVSGCGCRCAMSLLQDIGLVAEPGGYSVYIGGNPYGKPVVGEKVAEGLPDDKVVPALGAILSVYSSQRGRMKYLHQVVKSIGSIPFAQAIEESCAG
ncbi:MAG: hypothetical protein KGZ79_05045 [Dethiobacter sp.]|jgi:nitrite reductase (NADH) large subunit|nr:hypothetical protein [Dethiobacter sp.]